MSDDLARLFETLDEPTLVVTATQRLTRWLQHRFAHWQEAQGRRVWERPRILPWGAWLQQVWDEARLRHDPGLPRLLRPTEAAALWERVVAATDGARLLRPEGAASNAMRAHEVMVQWRIPEREVAAIAGEDGQAFLQWRARFQSRLARHGWVDAPALPAAILEHLVDVFANGGDSVTLTGFDNLPPLHTDLLDALTASGRRVRHWSPQPLPSAVQQAPTPDLDTEISAFAAWAHERLAHQPETTVALVVPDLAGRRDEIERGLDDGLSPAAAAPWRDAGERPWNLSLGRPLADYPLVHDALLMLRLLADGLSLPAWSLLLRSPFMAGGTAESAGRAGLDRRLRRIGELDVAVSQVQAIAVTFDDEGGALAPRLAQALDDLRSLVTETSPARPSIWARHFADALAALGWPGDRPLDSHEYQAVEAWHGLLGALTGLDEVYDRLTAAEAVALASRLASRQTFQPAGNEAAPIQVMGVLEVAGMRFDGVWVLGADDETWPPSLQPVPFLPVSLQRRYGVPEADPQAALRLARHISERINGAAPEVVWSWPRRQGDSERRPSPMVETLPQIAPTAAAAPSWSQRIHEARAHELIDDRQGTPLAKGSRMPGGSAFFRAQAACPFRGYALHRLNAQPLEAGRFGLDARERGSLLHRTLERVWQRLRSSEALQSTNIRPLVEAAVDEALAGASRRRQATFSERFMALERDRLVRLVIEWLERERQRSPFEIRGTEVERVIELGGLEFLTRLDRVDRLADGTDAVIDYKSGRASLNGLIGDERPDDLQLALYARCHDAPVAAVLFAQVRPGDCRFVGLVRERDIAPATRTPERLVPGVEEAGWPQLEAFWDEALATLAAEGRRGEAAVAPKRGACTWCPLPGLCRIAEGQVSSEVNDE